MNGLQKTLALILSAAMVLSCLSVSKLRARAAEVPEEEQIVVEMPDYVPDVQIPESEELYGAYLEHLFYGGNSVSLLNESAREQLNPLGKQFYDYLKAEFQKIAAGESASTAVTITAEQFASWGATLEYSTDTAKEAFNSFMGQFEFSNVFNALLYDCPYELYWFDKVTGVKQGASFSGVPGNYSISSVKLSFAVVEDLQPDGYSSDNPTFDTSNAKAASDAAANAKSIAEAYADASDYAMLKGYQEEICSLVSYDRTAASSGSFSTDADPWQLIYVFDRDASTNVVCEGYSKAFQYLCDLSVFRGDVACSTVSGTMTTGTSTGGHMWNIVSIDGTNYLADVTNSDSGTSGQDGSLFLAGTAGDIEEGYSFKNILYQYSSAALALWGSGEDSILKLAETNYTPPEEPQPVPEEISQAEFEAALVAVEENGEYVLDKALRLSADLTLDLSCTLIIGEGGSITVPEGVTLDCRGKESRAQILVEGGGTLTVQAGGTLSIEGSGAVSVAPGGVLTVQDGAFLSASQGGIIGRLLEGAVIDGVTESLIALVSYPVTGEELAAWAEAGLDCGSHEMFLETDVTLTRYTAIPPNTCLELNVSGGSGDVVLTVPEGQSLTNMGTIRLNGGSELWVQAGGKLTDRGTISSLGGKLTLEGTQITDVTEDLENVAANSAGQNRPVAAIRVEVQSMDTAALKTAMQDDRDGTGAVGSVAQLEEMAGGPAQVLIADQDCAFDVSEISVIGANLSTPVPEDGAISLEVGRSSETHDIPGEYDSATAVQFSLNLKNTEDPRKPEVPVKITLPVPQGILTESLVVLYFSQGSGAAEVLDSYVFAQQGRYYVCFVLTGFSDFAMAYIPQEPVRIPGDLDGDGQVSDADAVYLRQSLLPGGGQSPISGDADFDGDGKVSEADAVYLLWHTLFPDRYPLKQTGK